MKKAKVTPIIEDLNDGYVYIEEDTQFMDRREIVSILSVGEKDDVQNISVNRSLHKREKS